MNAKNKSQNGSHRWVALLLAVFLPAAAGAANPDGDLRIEVIAAYNLVVDSNAESPSSYAPRSAYLGATYHNDGTNTLTDVWAYIGDYTNGTPGIYPSRAQAPYVGPLPGDEFALTHEGGSLGAGDASRYLGTIEPGGSATVYWLVSYPSLDENGDAVTGGNGPEDDLWLQYSVWGTALDGASPLEAAETRTVTMRSEISAAANKIFPNGANKVPDEYKDLLNLYAPSWTNTADNGTPGTAIKTEGIWYDLGNVGAGFDNDGDLVPDRNAWLQPVGDPALFDPSCFRLVRTHAIVIVKLTDGTDQVYMVENQLYFTGIPENNNGAVGYVMYEFLSLRGGCSSTLTPYQEVASGRDNEKFNADFGATLGQPLTSGTTSVQIAKSADPVVTRAGSNIAYAVAFTNSGTVAVGHPELLMPLAVQDSIPAGTVYVAGSATNGGVLPAGVAGYAVHYSTNHGASWGLVEPVPAAAVTDLEWWLSDPLAPGAAGSVSFAVTVDAPYTNASPMVPNTAGLAIGRTLPFLTAEARTLVQGVNALGNLVWGDDGAGGGLLGNRVQEGGETGFTGVTVRLYFDTDGDGTVGAGDSLIGTTNTGAGGTYGFADLPDGDYVVAVESTSTNLPAGYTPTTPTTWAIALDPARTNANAVTNLTADFGFAPTLVLEKTLFSTNAFREGQYATFHLTASNSLPGDGTGNGSPATYFAWANGGTAGATEWVNYPAAYTPPGLDGTYCSNQFAAASKPFVLSNFPAGVQGGSVSNVSLLLPIVNVPPIGTPATLEIRVDRLSPAARIFTSTYMATGLISGVWTIPMTGTFAWAWADFATNYTVTLLANKGGGAAGTGWLQLDAAGFRIQSSELTGEAGDLTTLNPVALTDQYDADLMQFVRAEPPPTTATTNGTTPDAVGNLHWNNVGPLYPGGAATVAVTFKLLQPPGSMETETANSLITTNVQLQSAQPANSSTSTVTELLLPAATLGDTVWRDLDGDGIQDTNETGIAGVAVSLAPPAGVDLGNGAGVPVTNLTDSAGRYLFESIPAAGVYTVRVDTATLPGGTGVNTYDEDGGFDGLAAVYLDPYAAPGHTNNLHLLADFGYQVGTTIEGSLWHDWDRGGETNREAGEDALANVTVYLCASPSPCGPAASLATNVTTTNGTFRFVGDYDGTYTVLVATNTGGMASGTWNLSFDADGTNTANYASAVVVSGGVARADFSYWRTGSYTIGDRVFYDWDGDGAQDPDYNEGIASVTVRLYHDANGDGVVDPNVDAFIASTSTALDGTYAFTHLFATNTYLVIVDKNDPDLPPRYFVTSDPYGALDARSVVTITNASDFAQDFGFQPYGYGSIGDTVWKDMNANGVQNGITEVGLSNIVVRLYVDFNADGDYELLRTAATDAAGAYLFENLPDGDYLVTVDAADAGLPVDAFGHVYYPSTAVSRYVVLADNSAFRTADFGFAPHAAIGDTVFWDANRNGTADYSEEGVLGATVRLYQDVNADGSYDTNDVLVASTNTDASGRYLFDNLLPGSYVVAVVTTNGPLAGASRSADPDSDGYACGDTNNLVPCDDQTARTLAGGQYFMGADFGYVPPGVLGDLLWIDTDNDGERDSNEAGIPYVSVVLYSNSVAIATNETDADGYYYFSGLLDATYHVAVATNDAQFPSGLAQTYDRDGTLDDQASDIVISGGIVVSVGGFPCTEGDLSIDFGYRYAGANSLGGTIGFDALPYDGVLNGTNASGVASNESAYAGVNVYLYLWNDDGDGLVEAGEYVQISSTATGADGDYFFVGLPDGDGDDQYLVSSLAPEDNLRLTTTNGSIPGVSVVETATAAGHTASAYLTVDVAPAITGMDFAYRATKNYDYGDLPETYQTLLPGGARHVVTILTNLYLGATVDAEPNGLPSAGADGDDLSGTDDEDGVELSGVWQDGPGGGTLQVTIGMGSGWLLGYFDFNGDGDFMDAGEMAVHQAVSSTGGADSDGVYSVPVDVPPGTINAATTTALNARFRLFPSDPGIPALAFSGTADNGEVEDYAWSLLGSIGDHVWLDGNGNGVQDAGETPLEAVRVFIDLNADGLCQTNEPAALTDVDGLYFIGGLTPGTYSVRVDTNTLAAELVPTWDRDGLATPHAAAVILAQGEVVRDVDFAYNVSMADLALCKTASTAVADEGGSVTYFVTVTNLGPDSADVVQIEDLLPAGLAYVSSSPSQGTYDSGTGLWEVGALAVSGSATLSIVTTVDSGTGGTSITNTASRLYSAPVDAISSNDVCAVSLAVRGADLEVRKEVDNQRPEEGDSITYRISVTNHGPSDTTGVAISDVLPAGLTFVSSSATQGAYDGGTGLWTVGPLAIGAGAWLDIAATVDFGTLGSVITNTASVSSNGLPDPVSANNSALVRIYVPPLVLTKTAHTNLVELGDTLTYTIIATNIGPWVHTNSTITDVLPAGTIFVPGSLSFASYPARSNTVESVRDEFAARVYTNQNGSEAWTAAWIEGGESDGATNGYAQVLTNGWASLGLTRSLARAADLSTAESAELSFSLRQATPTLTNNIRDEFGAVAYTNNNGTLAWTGNWVEAGDDLSPASGDIQVAGGVLSFIAGLDANDGVGRWVKIGGNTNATLTFDYVAAALNATRSMNVYVVSNTTEYLLGSFTAAGSGTASYDLTPYLSPSLSSSNRIVFRAGGSDWASQSFTVDNVNLALARPMQTSLDNAYVEVSTNGSNWTAVFSANGNLAGTVTTNFDLTAYRTTQTWVRFRTSGYSNSGARLWFDNVDLAMVKLPGADEVGDLPDLLSGWTIGTNEGVVITYQVVVDDTVFTTQVVNTATATSDLQEEAVSATATTRVDLVAATVGDRVWFDANNNGIQDVESNNGIASVPVMLMRTNDTAFQSVVTDTNGYYFFTNVVPGTYYVLFDLRAFSTNDYILSPANVGGDDALDSDATFGQIGDFAGTDDFVITNGQTNLTIDLGFDPPEPTRVVLYNFTVGEENGVVVVRWRTASEENTVGFFVERLEDGQWMRVNPDIIYAKGEDGFGASYALVDPAAVPGGTYTYRIIEIETVGRETYGPFERIASALELLSPITVGPDGVLIRWLGREGEAYKVLRSTNLLEGAQGFQVIASGLPAAPEGNEYLDRDAAPMALYLIQVDGE